MKRLLTIAPVVATLTMAWVPESKAGSCSSAASVTSSLWKKYGDVATKLGCTVASAASQGAVDLVTCVQQVGKYDESVKKMVGYWNTMAASSWATIGPRRWDMDKTHKGKIVGTAGRMFIMPAPVEDNNFYVELEKTDGKGKASFTVCQVAPDGTKKKVWDMTVAPGSDNKGKTWRKRLPNTKGYIYTVHLDGKSVAKSLSYQLRTI